MADKNRTIIFNDKKGKLSESHITFKAKVPIIQHSILINLSSILNDWKIQFVRHKLGSSSLIFPYLRVHLKDIFESCCKHANLGLLYIEDFINYMFFYVLVAYTVEYWMREIFGTRVRYFLESYVRYFVDHWHRFIKILLNIFRIYPLPIYDLNMSMRMLIHLL